MAEINKLIFHLRTMCCTKFEIM